MKEPRRSQSLKRAIEHLLTHPDERQRLGEAGRRTVEKLLTVDHFADRVADLVDRVAPSRSRTSGSVVAYADAD